jgi:glycosyltransferase involved in cell wall biosynthesis
MKILMLHNDYREAGGERVSVKHEVEALRTAGAEVDLLQVSNTDFSSSARLGAAMLTRGSSRNRILDAIDQGRPDLIHAQNLFPLLGAGAIEAAEQRRVPWVRTLRNYRLRCLSATLHRNASECLSCTSAATAVPGVVHRCYKQSRIFSAGAVAYARLERSATTSYPPSAYILLSGHMHGLLAGNLGDVPIRVSANVVPKWPTAKPRRADLDFDVLFVGRPVIEKGWSVFLELARRLPASRFLAVTSGPLDRPGDRPLNLTFRSDLANAEVLELMSRSAVTVVPSQWEEPFGRVVIESLATGTPCLVSDRGGLPEIVRPVDKQLVVESDSVDAWQRSVQAIVDTPEGVYDTLARACLGHWASEYAPEASAVRLLSIYAGALENHRSRPAAPTRNDVHG